MQQAKNHTDMPTTISVEEELADELYSRKGRGESYNDVIWRLIEKADAQEDGDAERNAPPAPPEQEAPEQDTQPLEEEQTLEDTIAEIADAVLPGSGQKLAARRDALRATVDYLRDEGSATPQQIQNDVYPDHTAFYTDGKDPARSWWKNCIYKGLRELAERSDVILKADTSGEWSYIGEDNER